MKKIKTNFQMSIEQELINYPFANETTLDQLINLTGIDSKILLQICNEYEKAWLEAGCGRANPGLKEIQNEDNLLEYYSDAIMSFMK